MNGCLDDEGPTVAALTLLGAAHAGCCTVLVSLVLNRKQTLTCLSSNSTFLLSSMRFLLMYLMATMFPWKKTKSNIPKVNNSDLQ